MQTVVRLIRRLLARGNYVLTREEPGIPPSLVTALTSATTIGTDRLSVTCLDNDVEVQADLLAWLPSDRVTFSCPIREAGTDRLGPGSIWPKEPEGPFLAVVDLDSVPLAWVDQGLPWLRRAEALALGLRLGSSWAGRSDVGELEAGLSAMGFTCVDVAHGKRLALPNAASTRLFLIAARSQTPVPESARASRYRMQEARSFMSRPLMAEAPVQPLLGRGSFGFAAGVFNPGAVAHPGGFHLLARADRTPWRVQRRSAPAYFASCQPWRVELDARQHITEGGPVTLEGMPDATRHRIEDFRLFGHAGDITCNHAVVSLPDGIAADASPLPLHDLRVRVGVSRYDPSTSRLTWCGWPTLDRPTGPVEKNWAMFSLGNQVAMIYAVNPYVLLLSDEGPAGRFRTRVEAKLRFPFDDRDLPLRNSINPVPYDDRHWLHVVHQVYPNKQYVFRALLIDRTSLLPVRVAVRPLACGWLSHPASILYLCSASVDATHVHLFAGIDDAGAIASKVARVDLDREWTSVPAPT